jgi:hypothetical protein
MKKLLLCFLLVIALTGCLGCRQQDTGLLKMYGPDEARASETVIMTVTDDSGNPVPDVRLYSPEYLGDTNEDGRLVTFFDEPGDYELAARKGEKGKTGFAEVKSIGIIRVIPAPVELRAYDGVPPHLPPGQTFDGEQHYKPSMTVKFRLINASNEEITLNNSAPWKIESRDGEMIFEPYALQVVVPLAPGEAKEWTWNQKDNNDRPASEGGYIVVLGCSAGEYRLRFWILPEKMMP